MRVVQQKIQPTESLSLEPVESIPETKPKLALPRELVGFMVAYALLVTGLAAFTIYQQHKLREEVTSVVDKNSLELEQLRTDVLTSTSENSTYLKILILRPGIDKQLARDIAHSVIIRAREHHRDPDLVLALIDVESNFNPHAISPMGAMGLTQIMPQWKTSLAIDRDLRDVDTSVNYGLKILGTYEQMFGGLELALTAYNKGPGQVAADMKVGRPPFNGYSESIMRTYARIKAWMRP